MIDLLYEFKDDFIEFTINSGIFPAMLFAFVIIPAFLFCTLIYCLFYPFIAFNDWSKRWFKNETNRQSKM